ncbi:CTD phosphatase Fcp1 [Recurvomyces mirabilis]|nr:CTD phosphatase Fcp1 [Recurvomyces mirabilis]
MRLVTPPGLKYPIAVTKVLVKKGQEVQQNEPLFVYQYRAIVHDVWDKDKREPVDKLTDFFAEFESELEGTVSSLDVRVDQVIKASTAVVNIEEPCKHETQFGGMCADCGKDMSESTYSTTKLNTERAKINTVHGHTKLLVSQDEANREDDEAKRRLIKSRKLSLVVDLDQTIIHATVDPTVAEWQEDEKNPNHEAVKHVRKFQLVDDGPGGRGTWYYIKLRPGLDEFLKLVSQYYELHIYTMATRAYAEEIAKLVDPDRKLFANRILSRDENGSMSTKTLKRLFPVDTKMVVIIDDRGDVWHWSPNLVKVSAYDFFVGIGDINSSFLPKRPELAARPPKPAKVEQAKGEDASEIGSSTAESEVTDDAAASKASTPASTPPSTNGEVSAVDRIMSMAGEQNEGSLKEKTEEQDETIAAQLQDRPLLQKQKMLEAAEQEAKASPAVEAAASLLAGNGDTDEDGSDGTFSPPKYRHNLLQDDDNELEHLGASLREIHNEYFTAFEKDYKDAAPLDRVAQLRPGHKNKLSPEQNLDNIPDAAAIMSTLKTRVLSGVHLVFSGIVPLGVNIQNHDISIWAKSFGATVSENISRRTTHLIASPERRTAKVRQAVKKGGRVKVLNQNWLFACFSQWKRVAEEEYLIHMETTAGLNGKEGAAGLPDGFDEGSRDQMLSSSDEEAAQTEDELTDGGRTPLVNGTSKQKLSLETDGLTDDDTDGDKEEWARHSPTVKREDSLTVPESAEEWDDIRDELDDFLGSDADDDESDAESVKSESTIPSDGLVTPPSLKRKRDALVEAEGGTADSGGDVVEEGESRLQKRKKEALTRTTSLTSVVERPGSANGVGKTPAVDEKVGGVEVYDEDGDEDIEGDLEAALAAELGEDGF